MSSTKHDLTGVRFGRLTVIKTADKQGGRKAWQCRCDCGNDVVVLAQSLKSRATQSCGCLHLEAITKNLAGAQIGDWSVLSQADRRSANGYVYWHCKCRCGLVQEVCAESLLAGKSYSCRTCSKQVLKRRVCVHGHDTEVWGRTSSQACRACIKDKALRANYGISLQEFIALYEYQGGKCAVCGKDFGSYLPKEPGFGRGSRIEVDHDHAKSKRDSVRGLLCGGRWAGCNRRLGRIDKLPWLRQVVAYIEHPPAQQFLKSAP